MKQKKMFIRFYLIFLLLFSTKVLYSQKNYELKFKDGYTENVIFVDNDADNIQKRYITVGLVEFGIRSFDDIFGASLNVDLKYEKFVNRTNQLLYINLGYSLVESQKAENEFEYELAPISFEINYKINFSSKNKTRVRRFNFFNPQKQNPKYDYTIHRAKLPINFKRNYYLKVGGLFNQYTDGRQFIINNNSLNLSSVRSYSLLLGISKQRMGYIHYKSEGFGEQRACWISDLYCDLIYSPLIYGYGIYYQQNNGQVIEESRLSNSLFNFKRIGFRLGSTYKISWIRSNITGSEFFYEFGYYPCINTNIFTAIFGYRFTFMSRNDK